MKTILGNFPQIYTDRLIISILAPQNKDSFYAYRCLTEVYLYKLWEPSSGNEVEDLINKNLAILLDTKNTWLQKGPNLIYDSLIRDIGIHSLEDDDKVEIGYTLAPEHQAKAMFLKSLKPTSNMCFSR